MNRSAFQMLTKPSTAATRGGTAFSGAYRGKAPMADAANRMAKHGRHGDTMLAHINPEEAALLKRRGGAGTRNPTTGAFEFYRPDESGVSSVPDRDTGRDRSSNPTGRDNLSNDDRNDGQGALRLLMNTLTTPPTDDAPDPIKSVIDRIRNRPTTPAPYQGDPTKYGQPGSTHGYDFFGTGAGTGQQPAQAAVPPGTKASLFERWQRNSNPAQPAPGRVQRGAFAYGMAR